MTALLSPQLASPVDMGDAGRYVVDPNYVAEQKLDGHRVMLQGVGNAGMVALTRNGSVYTKGLPLALMHWRTQSNTSNIILDGELVGGTFWAFDLLAVDGSLDTMPLEDRRMILEAFAAATPDAPFRVVPQAKTVDEKQNLLLTAASQDMEGVVFKRVDQPYQRGIRSPYWLKVKFVQTADVVIVALRDDGKESATLGIYPKDSLETIVVGRCSLIGKPKVQIHDVVEVRYLYVPDRTKPRLYQPTLIRVRDDKTPAECDGSDFKYTNKAVLATL